VTHEARIRALLTELGQVLDELEATKAPQPKPPRKTRPRRKNVAHAIVEARRAARKA